MVEYDTFNHLILNNGFKIHPLFESFSDVISKHLKYEKETILKNIELLCKKHPKPIKASINIYNLMMIIDYNSLKNELTQKLNSL